MRAWIDFKRLREQLDFEQVLRHYHVEIKRKGVQHLGYCPLPKHNGKRNSPSFSANLKKGVFQCFGCGAKGNVLDFAALMENVSTDDGVALRKVAGALQERFLPATSDKARPPREGKLPPPKVKAKDVMVNAPLDFQLKELDPDHSYLRNRGFSRETIDHFGLGFCARGYLKNRIAIPLHDDQGKLVGYAGRIVNDALINADCPKYLFPSSRERQGITHEFRKSLFLYNGDQVSAPVERLAVVEGFSALWWFHQAGIPEVVATMGASCSDEQAALIVRKVTETGTIWIFSDGDDAGERHAKEFFAKIAPHRTVRLVRSPDGKQPTDMSMEALLKLLPPQAKAPVQAVPVVSSIKRSLENKEINVREAIVALADSMPALRSLNLTVETWDAERVDALSGKLSSGERACVQFLLHVWNCHRQWQAGAFSIGSLDSLDETHRRVFAGWASDPWWC